MTDRNEERRYHHGHLRAALLEAAEQTLRSQGLAALSLRDLAREVGVSHAAPRRHFPERQDLLDALAQIGYARLGDDILQAISEGGSDYTWRVQRAASSFALFAVTNPALLELMNVTKQRPGAIDVQQSSAAAFAPILHLIQEGQDTGVLRPGAPEELGLILYATMNGIAMLVNTGAIDKERLADLTAMAVAQFLKGAAP